MKKLIILCLGMCSFCHAFGWGQKGHDTTAYIAECHLTPEAAEQIDKILGGRSMVYYANWLDVASYTPEYTYAKPWHYLNIEEGKSLSTTMRNPDGDVLSAVESIVAKLKKGGLTSEEETLNLKMLIHFVGDMHCPMHLGRLNDLGGNLRKITFFKTPADLHTVWDTQLVEAAHRWSYTEWQEQIDRVTDDEAVLLQAGEPRDWVKETHGVCVGVYAGTPEGADISYDYVENSGPVIELQFLRGGYRLARLLNEIYR